VTGTLALITILALVALDALATAEPVIEEVGHVVIVVILISINHSLSLVAENACVFRASWAKPMLFSITKVKTHRNALQFN
jgi:hypothetical protein